VVILFLIQNAILSWAIVVDVVEVVVVVDCEEEVVVELVEDVVVACKVDVEEVDEDVVDEPIDAFSGKEMDPDVNEE
jgi:hypothetical protein